MTGICTSPYPSPYPIEKVGDFWYTYPYSINAGDSPSKRERVRAIPTGTGLFAISRWHQLSCDIKWSCHNRIMMLGLLHS